MSVTYRSFRQGIGTLLLGSGLAKLLLAGAELSLAYGLGASGYGVFAIAFALLLLIASLLQLGTNFAVVHYFGASDHKRDAPRQRASISRAAIGCVFGTSLIASLLLFTFADRIATQAFGVADMRYPLQLIACFLPFEALNQSLSGIFRGLREFRLHVLVADLLRNAIFAAGILGFLFFEISAESAIVLVGLGSASASVAGINALRKRVDLRPQIAKDISSLRELLAFSWPLIPWQVLQKFANQFMVVIAGVLLNAGEVGIFAVALRIANLFNFPSGIVMARYPVEFASLYARNKSADLKKLLRILSVGLIGISGVVGLLIIINADLVMNGLGVDYQDYGWVIQVLVLAKIIDVGTGPISQALIACRKRKTVLAIASIDAMLQFLFVVPLILFAGLIGAVVGNAVRIILIVIARHMGFYATTRIPSVSPALILLFIVLTTLLSVGLYLSSLNDTILLDAFITVTLMGIFSIFVMSIRIGQISVIRYFIRVRRDSDRA